jgi:enterochelin esterase-like enzyme
MNPHAALPIALLAAFAMASSSPAADTLSVPTLETRLAEKPAGEKARELAEDIRVWFGKDRSGTANVIDGSPPKVEGLDTAWAIEAPGASSAAVVVSDDKILPLLRVGDTPVFAGTLHCDHGTAFRWSYVRDPEKNLEAGASSRRPLVPWWSYVSQHARRERKGQFEVYAQPSELSQQPGVPKGTLIQQKSWESKIYPNTTRDWWVYIPAQYQDKEPACVMVFQDGGRYTGFVPTVFDNLIAKRQMPVTVGVFIDPGRGRGEAGRGQRSVEYDTLSDRYAGFLLEEILPEVEKSVKLRHDPESRAVAGLSSGGICAWTVAWERPDEFRKVLSWVGSFTNIASGPTKREGGHNYEALIRKTSKKPIRVFLQDGANDLDNNNGNWPLANQQMAKALEFARYDYRFVFGNGFHSHLHGRAILPDSLRWLWRDYKPGVETKPKAVPPA